MEKGNVTRYFRFAKANHDCDEMLDSALVAGTGAALELYQASALMHDDVIDDASLRRGQPATHRRLQALHRDRAWLGDARAFGAAAAILLGDLLLSAAGEELAAAQTTDRKSVV